MLAQFLKITLTAFFILKVCSFSFSQAEESEKLIVVEFKIIGNKTTRENIIVREIPFQILDTLNANELSNVLERTKSNLFNTLLFNFVTVEPVYYDSTHISIYITVEERWYWWPIPIFDIEETNFNTWWLDKNLDKVNYGLFVSKENFRGRKETAMFKFQTGYTEEIGLKYIIPYINRKKTNGLSLKFSYSRNHELTYGTTNNVRDFFRQENDYVKKEINTYAGYEFRPKLYNKHIFYLEYTNVEVSDSVLLLNDNYLSNGEKSMEFLSLIYTVKRDKRNFKSYPTKGYYFDMNVYKDGIGIINNNNSLYLTSELRKFWQLSNKFYFSSSIKGKFTINEGPYYLFNGLGFRNNLVRGYEFYVINGENYSMIKTQLRYGLLQNKVFKFSNVPAEKFNKIPLSIYLGAFMDAGYVDSKTNYENNFLVNSALLGAGVAVDFVSYYDIVFRIEYSINKMNESGLFLHFVAPI